MDHIEYPELFALLQLDDVNPAEKRVPPKPEAVLAPLDTVDPPKKVNILTHHDKYRVLQIIYNVLHTAY